MRLIASASNRSSAGAGTIGFERQAPYAVTRARASAADSGNAYDGIGASAAGAPSARMNTPSTGLPCVPSTARRDRCGDGVRLGDERRNEDGDDAINRVVSQNRGQRPTVVFGRRRCQHVHGIPDARCCRQERSQLRSRDRRSSGEMCRPFASHASAARMPGPPALVRIATRAPRGTGWCESSAATSNISSSRSVRITPACLKSASTTTSLVASAPVCEAAARDPALDRPALTATIGFVRPTRRAISLNFFGFPKLSRYSRITDVLASSAQSCDQIVSRHVRLVADRHEARDPDIEPPRVIENRQPERAALSRHRDASPRRIDRRERRVQLDGRIGIEQAHAIRTDQAAAGPPHLLNQRGFECPSVRITFAEAGTDDANRRDVLADAIVHGGQDLLCRNDHHRQINRAGDIRDATISCHSSDLGGSRVNGNDRSGESGNAQVVEDFGSNLSARTIGTNDGDDTGFEERSHGCRRGDLRSCSGVLDEFVGQRQRQ